MTPLPSDLVIATLHYTTDGFSFTSDEITNVFDKSAKLFPDLYGKFKAHQYYRYSKELEDVLIVLVWGGCICIDTSVPSKYHVGLLITGSLGARIAASYGDADLKIIRMVASELQYNKPWTGCI